MNGDFPLVTVVVVTRTYRKWAITGIGKLVSSIANIAEMNAGLSSTDVKLIEFFLIHPLWK